MLARALEQLARLRSQVLTGVLGLDPACLLRKRGSGAELQEAVLREELRYRDESIGGGHVVHPQVVVERQVRLGLDGAAGVRRGDGIERAQTAVERFEELLALALGHLRIVQLSGLREEREAAVEADQRIAVAGLTERLKHLQRLLGLPGRDPRGGEVQRGNRLRGVANRRHHRDHLGIVARYPREAAKVIQQPRVFRRALEPPLDLLTSRLQPLQGDQRQRRVVSRNRRVLLMYNRVHEALERILVLPEVEPDASAIQLDLRARRRQQSGLAQNPRGHERLARGTEHRAEVVGDGRVRRVEFCCPVELLDGLRDAAPTVGDQSEVGMWRNGCGIVLNSLREVALSKIELSL